MTKLIVNCETGEVTERPLNKAENSQQEIDEAEFLALQELKAQKAAERLAIAERIGLSADDLKTLGL
jgi:hypothetical protein